MEVCKSRMAFCRGIFRLHGMTKIVSVHVMMQFQLSVYKADTPRVCKGLTPNYNPDMSPK